MFLFALLVIVAAVYTTRKTPEKLVNRDQTEEWKGWMQVQLRKWISHWGQKRKLFQTDITAALHRNSWLSLPLSTETQRIFVPSCVSVCLAHVSERSFNRYRWLLALTQRIRLGWTSDLPLRPSYRLFRIWFCVIITGTRIRGSTVFQL